MKRSEIARSTKPMRYRSKKREREMVARRVLVAKILTERPRCEFPDCGYPSTAVHEPLTRARGGSILDETNVLALCLLHHTWTHDNPAAAKSLGLLRHSWESAS